MLCLAMTAPVLGQRLLYDLTGPPAATARSWALGSVGVGDVNGDGKGDFALVSELRSHGELVCLSGADASSLWRTSLLRRTSPKTHLGRIGDLDADGVAELLLADPEDSSHAGICQVFSGRLGGLLRTHRGPAASVRFGASTVPLNDVDRDGVADYAVAVRGTNTGIPAEVVVFSGRTGLVHRRIKSHPGDSRFALHTMPAGDLDADGAVDLMIAVYSLHGTNRPAVHVFSARTGQLIRTLGSTAQLFGGLGDLDSDGRDDFAYSRYNGRLEFAIVSGATQADLFVAPLPVNTWAWVLSGGLDVDGDRVPDFVLGENSALRGQFEVFSGRTRQRLYGGTWPRDIYGAMALAPDISGDGFFPGANDGFKVVTVRAAIPK